LENHYELQSILLSAIQLTHPQSIQLWGNLDLAKLLGGRVLICAFEGWNDAAESASGAARVICQSLDCKPVAQVDSEDYYDYQFTRPQVSFNETGQREISWPGTEFLISNQPNFERFSVLLGNEPARRWKSFTSEILEMIEDREVDLVVFLGGMLADSPHTRPITITSTSQNETVRQALGIEMSSYEGPVGIVSVLGMALEEHGIPSLALWAAVPHYVHNSPSPKASLALLVELEKLMGISFEHGDLADQAFTWERGIDEIASSDDEMAHYIEQLEKNRDEFESEAASGEAIARELEKFLESEQGPEN
jgi:proteasome assembly chaperone (PAC2) family protein